MHEARPAHARSFLLAVGAAALCSARVALAQGALDQLTIPDPPALPAPSLFERFVLEDPWIAALVLLAVAIGVFLAFSRVGQRRQGTIAALTALLAAAAVLVAGTLVETPRERMMDSARRLVDAVARGDAQDADRELDDHAILTLFLFPDGIEKDRILAEVAARFTSGPYTVKEHRVIDVQASRDGSNVGRVQIKVRVVPRDQPTPFFSWWLLDFQEHEGAWRVAAIRPLSMSFVRDPMRTGP